MTALIGLASHRAVTWIASAMTDEDVAAAEHNDGKPFPVTGPDGDEYRVKLVASDPEAYDGFYNIIANPMLWFIQHYLWDLSNAPDIRRHETEAFEFGYNVVNEDLARAVLEEIEDVSEPVVMVHDYHLYTLPGLIRRERPDVFLHHFVHIPWSQSDSWRVLPTVMRDGALPRDPRPTTSSASTPAPTAATSCSAARTCSDSRSTTTSGMVRVDDREVWVAPIRCRSTPTRSRRSPPAPGARVRGRPAATPA